MITSRHKICVYELKSGHTKFHFNDKGCESYLLLVARWSRLTKEPNLIGSPVSSQFHSEGGTGRLIWEVLSVIYLCTVKYCECQRTTNAAWFNKSYRSWWHLSPAQVWFKDRQFQTGTTMCITTPAPPPAHTTKKFHQHKIHSPTQNQKPYNNCVLLE